MIVKSQRPSYFSSSRSNLEVDFNMKPRDDYLLELLVACVVRYGLYCGSICLLAFALVGCTVGGPQDLLSGRPVVNSPLGDDRADRTRNQQPQGGCDEKSGTTPTEPLGRFPKAMS